MADAGFIKSQLGSSEKREQQSAHNEQDAAVRLQRVECAGLLRYAALNLRDSSHIAEKSQLRFKCHVTTKPHE